MRSRPQHVVKPHLVDHVVAEFVPFTGAGIEQVIAGVVTTGTAIRDHYVNGQPAIVKGHVPHPLERRTGKLPMQSRFTAFSELDQPAPGTEPQAIAIDYDAVNLPIAYVARELKEQELATLTNGGRLESHNGHIPDPHLVSLFILCPLLTEKLIGSPGGVAHDQQDDGDNDERTFT